MALADDIADKFWGGVIKLVAAPVALPIKAVRNAKTKEAITREEERQRQLGDARDAVRQQQWQELFAAVPSTPPEKMRATIRVNEIRVPDCEQQFVGKNFRGDKQYTSVEVGELTKFAVDLILELPETDRAIILQHDLAYFVLEDRPMYTEHELREMSNNAAKVREGIAGDRFKDLAFKEIRRHNDTAMEKLRRRDRTQTTVADFLSPPFSRSFDTPHEAKMYADELKSKTLPGLKKLIDDYRDHQETETLEF